MPDDNELTDIQAPAPAATQPDGPKEATTFTPTYRDPETGKLVTGRDEDGKPIFQEDVKNAD